MDSIIYTRVKEQCMKRGITIAELERALGMSQYAIGAWKNRTTPSVDSLANVARYFCVSMDYLMGLTDISTPADILIGDADFAQLQRAKEKMSEEDKGRMMSIIKIGFDYAFEDDEQE